MQIKSSTKNENIYAFREHVIKEIHAQFPHMHGHSPAIQAIVKDALRNCGITIPAIILEKSKSGNSDSVEGAVYSDTIYVLIESLHSCTESECNSRIFALYRACAKVYQSEKHTKSYQEHSKNLLIKGVKGIFGGVIGIIPTNTGNAYHKILGSLYSIFLLSVTKDLLFTPKIFYDSTAKDADLFACYQLARIGRVDIITQERDAAQLVNPARAQYLDEFLDNLSIYRIYEHERADTSSQG